MSFVMVSLFCCIRGYSNIRRIMSILGELKGTCRCCGKSGPVLQCCSSSDTHVFCSANCYTAFFDPDDFKSGNEEEKHEHTFSNIG